MPAAYCIVTAVVAASLLWGCSGDEAEPESMPAAGSAEPSSMPAQMSAVETRQQALRRQIIELSLATRSPCDADDNDPDVRAELNTLITELVEETDDRSEREKVGDVVGLWEQIWSDTRFTSFPPQACYVGDRIWQVVFEDGFYYNLSQVDFPDGPQRLFVRGQFEIATDALDVTFTGSFFTDGDFGDVSALRAEALRAESGGVGERREVGIPPAGTPGTLRNLYVDETLRVTTDGGDAAESNGIFVLRRVREPIVP